MDYKIPESKLDDLIKKELKNLGKRYSKVQNMNLIYYLYNWMEDFEEPSIYVLRTRIEEKTLNYNKRGLIKTKKDQINRLFNDKSETPESFMENLLGTEEWDSIKKKICNEPSLRQAIIKGNIFFNLENI